MKLFENFIKYLQLNNIKIIFFLPPYNPITYDILMKKPKYHIINRAEEYLINFANKNNIEIKGSYNPHKYNFKYTDFSDGNALQRQSSSKDIQYQKPNKN